MNAPKKDFDGFYFAMAGLIVGVIAGFLIVDRCNDRIVARRSFVADAD